MATNNTKNWSSLPPDLLISISNLLSLENYVVFGSVCRSWRSVAPKEKFNSSNPQLLPWLMLRRSDSNSDEPQTPQIYSLTNQKLYRVPHPPHRSYRTTNSIFSSLGWIISATNVEHRNDIVLFHPFSPNDNKIQLPCRNINVVSKFALSSKPSLSSFDFTVVAIHRSRRSTTKNCLSFWRPGSSSWTRISTTEPYFFLDVVFFKGRFYAVDCRRRVIVLNLDLDRDDRMVAVVSELNLPKSEAPFLNPYDVEMLYLVESEGDLLVVQGDRQWWGQGKRETTEFRVFKVNVNDGSFYKEESLGDVALFLGDKSSSFSVKASEFGLGGCKCNSIYFADDFRKLENFWVRSKDVGIFGMKDRKVEPVFGFEDRDCDFLAPVWVQPSVLLEDTEKIEGDGMRIKPLGRGIWIGLKPIWVEIIFLGLLMIFFRGGYSS